MIFSLGIILIFEKKLTFTDENLIDCFYTKIRFHALCQF